MNSLKNLEILEVYVADTLLGGPEFYLGLDPVTQIKYLVNWTGLVDTTHSEWCAVAVSARRLESLKLGNIDIRTAFEHPESGILYKIVGGTIYPTKQKNIPLDDIPKAGLYLPQIWGPTK